MTKLYDLCHKLFNICSIKLSQGDPLTMDNLCKWSNIENIHRRMYDILTVWSRIKLVKKLYKKKRYIWNGPVASRAYIKNISQCTLENTYNDHGLGALTLRVSHMLLQKEAYWSHGLVIHNTLTWNIDNKKYKETKKRRLHDAILILRALDFVELKNRGKRGIDQQLRWKHYSFQKQITPPPPLLSITLPSFKLPSFKLPTLPCGKDECPKMFANVNRIIDFNLL